LVKWGVVSSYSSATASGFHGIPSSGSLTCLNSQRTAENLTNTRQSAQEFNSGRPFRDCRLA
jgi:hypothetical protein